MEVHDDPRQIVERSEISRDNGPGRRRSCRCNDQIVGAPRPSLSAYRGEQQRMGLGNGGVVGDHGHRSEHVLDERSTACTSLPTRELDAHTKLCNGYSGDGHVVVVSYDLIQ